MTVIKVVIFHTYVPKWQKMELEPTSDEHSLLASHIYFCMHFPSAVDKDLT